ncbi:MAG: 30S ribosome-binding factor RbfA [Acidimicrobiaceae bacterium]|nr:30S ribosome-binding factor RbfA [Acidimicrobiaceae bacterium]
MVGRRRGGRGRRSAPPDPAAAARTARVGELIRRIVASELESIDDDRLDMASITSVDVDRALHRAVVWFTTLDGDDEPAAAEAFDEHVGVLRKAVGSQARLRHTPLLEFRPDTVLRSAERIEDILRDDRNADCMPSDGSSEPGDGS